MTGHSRTAPGAGDSQAARDAGDDEDDPEHVTVRVRAVHDAAGRLVELRLRGARPPCLLLKLLALCAPHQPHLARLSLRSCALDAGALHQLAALLPASRLERLCLDDSPPRAHGYHALLEAESRLRCLSLDRCRLGDAGAAALAAALHHPLPASRALRSLSLATNGIGDAGARALAAALRSNRALRHLDLADNRVTDAGAAALLGALAEFPLTRDEALDSRRRYVAHLGLRRELRARILASLRAAAAEHAAEQAARRRPRKSLAGEAAPVGDSLEERADRLADELLGPFEDPFCAHQTKTRDGVRYCHGNAALCWLNVAYNALGPAAPALLAAALRAQAARRAGLLRVQLDGNALPAACAALRAAAADLEAALELAQPIRKPASGKSKSSGLGAVSRVLRQRQQ